MLINSIFSFLVPKDKKFFKLLIQSAQNLEETTSLLKTLVNLSPDARDLHTEIAAKIKKHENIGDEFTHTIYDELNTTFITPFDREDIHRLASTMDDVLDYINSFSQKIEIYKPLHFMPSYYQFSEVIEMTAMEILKIMTLFDNPKNFKEVMISCVRINELENTADDIYHAAVSDLFENEKDAIEILKQKDIFLILEKVIDKAEDVSDVVKSIIIKAA